MEKISGGKEKNKVVNELLKDNPHMSKKRVRETEKKREKGKRNLVDWRRKLGEGAESLSTQPPGEGEPGWWWWWGPPSGELLKQIM